MTWVVVVKTKYRYFSHIETKTKKDALANEELVRASFVK